MNFPMSTDRRHLSLKIFVLPLALLALSFLICAAQAATNVFPSSALNGSSGLIRIPSADIIPYKNFNLGGAYGQTLPDNGASNEATAYYMMNLGTFHGVEVGIVGGTNKGSSQVREGVFVNMKLALSTGDEPDPMLLAIGVENLFSYSQTDVYMVATKYFKQGPKLTFGFQGDFPGNRFRPLGMAGIEFPIGDTMYLLSDLIAGETLMQVNGGLRLYLTPIFSVTLSGLNLANNIDAKDARAALVGFSWANPF
ncbi:hypothetical protein COT42_05310 [Candidatus Saganbacteria bacterium CG08_land_8_20_14_0_20_45_16]|uniref:Transporter n=1 Tax=Candidatus Saganbacteria bacterium CG08_land_8_20_14_0_20_45_16 TaxID=2014293 RepID=A0A2H0XXF5_UNCSA|nr:MAG: hypothetical protein COT42_05310 [Candidatus Saganbacteria bacterium CG08_land_8_20_14_0_20_45_16]